MLRVQGFEITDDKGINELLTKYRLAASAHILISQGKVLIPYEDGSAPNIDQQIIAILEERNTIAKQSEIIIHSQKVLEVQEEGILAEMEKVEQDLVAPGNKKAYDKNKDLNKEKNRLQNVLDQTRNQLLMNQVEITRMFTNIKVFDTRVDELRKEKASA